MDEKEMLSIEASGKSVDEALTKGLLEMGLSLDEVSYEIIRHETKGILGIGAKPAIVRLTKKPAEEFNILDYLNKPSGDRKRDRKEKKDRPENRPEKQDKPENKPEKPEKQDKPEKKEKPAPAEKQEKPERGEKQERRPRPENRPENRQEKNSKPREANKAAEGAAEPAGQSAETAPERPAPRKQPADKGPRPEKQQKAQRERRSDANAPEAPKPEEKAAAEEPEKVINYTLEAAQGNPAAEFVKGLIERMGASGQVLAAQDDDCLRLRIDSEMMGMLIGHRGETLDAMQYLTGLVINKNRKTEGYTRVTLNTEEYREKREETLRRLAKKVASQVRASGRPRVLEPMNPYERRVLHSTLQNNPDVTTHSEGEEPNRRVVVTPKRKGGRGYSRGRGGRRSAESRQNYSPAEDKEDFTISAEEYQKLYEAARAANPFMSRPTKEE